MSSVGYHEPIELLSEATKNMHRAVISLIEELEAVDWYQQRGEACSDPDLQAVLFHNRDEEVEHAMMTLEWLRRHSPVFDTNMRTYLFTEGSIAAHEGEDTGGPGGTGESNSLGIGSLKHRGDEES